jgi:hypothetical protein
MKLSRAEVPSRAEQRCLLGFHLDKSYELVQRQIGGKEEEFQELVLIICLLVPKEEDAIQVDFGGDSCRWWRFETRLPGKSKSVLGF